MGPQLLSHLECVLRPVKNVQLSCVSEHLLRPLGSLMKALLVFLCERTGSHILDSYGFLSVPGKPKMLLLDLGGKLEVTF